MSFSLFHCVSNMHSTSEFILSITQPVSYPAPKEFIDEAYESPDTVDLKYEEGNEGGPQDRSGSPSGSPPMPEYPRVPLHPQSKSSLYLEGTSALYLSGSRGRISGRPHSNRKQASTLAVPTLIPPFLTQLRHTMPHTRVRMSRHIRRR